MLKLIPLILTMSASLLFCSPKAEAQVWNETNQWSQEYEETYSAWVRDNWSADFFSKELLANGQKNPYYGLRVDCADAVYSMRVIFSYEHNLPFAIQDPTTTKRLITNQMTRWNKTSDQNQRFRSFLTYLYDMVSTNSLPNDTFPVPVDRQFIRSGGLIRTTTVNHHSWTIKEIQSIGVPFLVFNSTVGRTSGFGMQQRISWPNPSWVFEGDFSPASNAGFRAWRPLAYLNLPVWQTPNYSEEQFQVPLKQWQKYVQKKLALDHETDEQTLTRLSKTACESLVTRTTAVNDGVQFLRSMTAQCMEFADYDTYSTPNRDQRLFDDMAALRRSYKDLMHTDGGQNLPETLKLQMAKIFPLIKSTVVEETKIMGASKIDDNSFCPVTYDAGKTIDFAEAKRRLFKNRFSNNPLDDIQYRWGEVQGPSERAKACLSWEIWQPDLKKAD